MGRDGAADRRWDQEVAGLLEPGILGAGAGAGGQPGAVHAPEAIAGRKHRRHVQSVPIGHSAQDVGDGNESRAGRLQVARHGAADVAEALQADTHPPDLHAQEGRGFQGAFRDPVAGDQLGDGHAVAAESQRLPDAAQPGAALTLESGLERVDQPHQLAGGDDLLLAGSQVGPGRIALGDEGPDRLQETAQHLAGVIGQGIVVDPGFGAAIGNVEDRHLVGHGAGELAHLFLVYPATHPDTARAHVADQPVDHEVAGRAGRRVMPLAHQVRRAGVDRGSVQHP